MPLRLAERRSIRRRAHGLTTSTRWTVRRGRHLAAAIDASRALLDTSLHAAHLLVGFRTGLAVLGALRAGVLVVVRADQHEVRQGVAHLGAGHHSPEVASRDVLAPGFQAVAHRHAEAGLVAAQAFVDAGLHLGRYIGHAGSRCWSCRRTIRGLATRSSNPPSSWQGSFSLEAYELRCRATAAISTSRQDAPPSHSCCDSKLYPPFLSSRRAFPLDLPTRQSGTLKPKRFRVDRTPVGVEYREHRSGFEIGHRQGTARRCRLRSWL